jgi:exocyst complex component 3
MAENYSEWMKNTLNLETEDWRKEGDPELDNEGCFHTSAPKIIYQVRLGWVSFGKFR